jgi:hypothetical protein
MAAGDPLLLEGVLLRHKRLQLFLLGKRLRNRFPSVLLQPLGHLSVSLESTVYGPAAEPENLNCVRKCVRPPNVPRSLTGTRRPWPNRHPQV